MPIERQSVIPGTLQRSPAKAQRTYAETLESAEEQYDSGARAQRTAWAAVKHSFEKVRDHWEAKDERGPSDPQAMQSGRAGRDHPKETFGGVDVVGNTHEDLYQRAKKAGIVGRSKMDKTELARALSRREA